MGGALPAKGAPAAASPLSLAIKDGGRGDNGLSLSEGLPPCYNEASLAAPPAFQRPPQELLPYLAGWEDLTRLCERAASGEQTLEQLFLTDQKQGIAGFSSLDQAEQDEEEGEEEYQLLKYAMPPG